MVAGEQAGEPVPVRGAEDDQIGLTLLSDVGKARRDRRRGDSGEVGVDAAEFELLVEHARQCVLIGELVVTLRIGVVLT